MNQLATNLLTGILTATAALTIATPLTWLVLRWSRTISPRVHRLSWCAALLVGCALVRLPIEVPWYAPSAPEVVSDEIGEAPPAPASVTTELPASATWQPEIQIVESIPAMPPTALESADDEEPPKVLTAEMPHASPILIAAEHASSSSPPIAVHETVATPSPVLSRRLDLPTLLVSVWLAGMVLIVLASLVGYLMFVWRLPAGLPAESHWQAEWQQLRVSRGIRQAIPLRVTNNLGPLLCRMPLGYCLAVPETLWREFDADSRAAILKHELAHFERGDVWSSLAIRLFALPQWFNPCSWFTVRRFDEAAEWACDRAVADEHSVADYARTLLRLGTDPHGYASYRPAASGKPLAARVRRLLRLRHERDSKLKGAVVIAVAIAMATVALVRVELVAQEPPIEKKDSADEPAKVLDIAIDTADKPTNQAKPLAAAQATMEAAQKAFDGNWTAYKDGRSTLDAVYIWSLRWLQAAERSPPQREPADAPMLSHSEHRLRAAKEHLARMKKVQEYVKAKFDVAARGGEHERMMEANFYVADAEQRIVDLEEANRISKNVYAPIGPSTAHVVGGDTQYSDAMKKAAAEREAKFGKITRVAVEEAQKAYTGTLASYLAGSSTLDPVIRWSTELLNAEQRLPNMDIAKYLEAEKSHLQRLQELQKQVKTLYETGSLGGQAENMASINFHVAQAEFRVAELDPLAPPAGISTEPTNVGRSTDNTANGAAHSDKASPLFVKIKGPQSKQVGETAEFVIVVENQGKAKEEHVELHVDYDRALDPVSLTDGYQFIGNDIGWQIAELLPGKSISLEVNCKCLGRNGPATVRVSGSTKDGDKASASTTVNIETKKSPAGDPLWDALRFQGKSAVEWSEILQTELSEPKQIEAIDALAAFVPKGHGREIATMLFDVRPKPDSKIESSVLHALLQIPRELAVPIFAAARRSETTSTRRLATMALAITAPSSDETKEAIKAALRDPEWDVTEPILNLLGSNGPSRYPQNQKRLAAMSELAPDLYAVLEHFELHPVEAPGAWGPIQRGNTIRALASCGPTAKIAFPIVIPWLTGDQSMQRDLAFDIVDAAGAEAIEAVPALIEVLKNRKRINQQPTSGTGERSAEMAPTVRALTALRTIGPAARAAAPVILEVTAESVRADRSPVVHHRGFQALEAMGLGKSAVPELIQAIKNGSYRVQMIEIVGKLGPDAAPAVEVLQTVISTQGIDDDEKLAAVKALGAIGSAAKPALGTLLEFAKDSTGTGTAPQSTLAACRAIRSIGAGDETPTFVGVLMAAVEKDETNRVDLITMLAELGPTAKEAIPLLEKFVRDDANEKLPNDAAAQVARKALELIQRDPESPVELIPPANSEAK